MTDWRDFPKLELHLHLEGAAPPPLVRRLAAEKGLDMVGVFDEAGHYNSNDFTSFLRTYERVSTVFSTPDDYRALTEAVLTECANNGVIYAEIFLSPTSLGYDPAKWTDYLAAIEEGADQAEQDAWHRRAADTCCDPPSRAGTGRNRRQNDNVRTTWPDDWFWHCWG